MAKHGYFSEDGRSFIVTEEYTETPYTNVLYNKDGYCTEINQWGNGTASVQFEDSEICTITPQNGKTIYLRNDNTGEVRSIGAEPMHSNVSDFSCEHGDGYSIVKSEYGGIAASLRIFVPENGLCEIQTVEITNNTEAAADISVVPAVKLDMSGYSASRFETVPIQSYTADFDGRLNGVYFTGGNPNAKDKPYDAFLAASEKVDFFSGDDRYVLAAPQSLSYPYALLRGKNLDSRACTAGEPFLALQCVKTIKPKETIRVSFMLGISTSVEEACKAAEILKSDGGTEQLFAETVKHIAERHSVISVSTPDALLNNFVNIWIKKGMEYCLRKKDATRDNLQFAMGLIHTSPELLKNTIRLVMRYQYSDGHTVRSWKPLDETFYSDGPIWLILAACEYVKYSDDTDFLNEKIKYYDEGSGTVMQHLERGINKLGKDKGEHGLCLMQFADWNDALNLADSGAESVFTSMGFAWCLLEMSDLCEYIKNDSAEKYRAQYNEMRGLINKTCWDEKGYYIRGFSGGKKIGSSESDGSKIFVNTQSWAILSGVAEKERIPSLLAAIDKYTKTELGCMVNSPAYEKYNPEVGRISFQVPGTYENGAVYCHATGFKINADTELGRGNEALEDIRKILPDSAANPAEKSGALPYALTSSYCTNPNVYGKAGRPWLTGTQSWLMRCVTEGLLGIKKTYGGFLIKPSFPDEWDCAECRILRKGTEYSFKIRRTGRNAVTVNGEESGSFVPFASIAEMNIEAEV